MRLLQIELERSKQYDYVVVNAALEDAVEDFKTIVKAEKLKTAYAENLINEVLENA